ncbi:hypothetical protein I4U23_010951 [Adineta vaga]|nr:hypothetical protein I4U23_010951 [Adineta vaga]
MYSYEMIYKRNDGFEKATDLVSEILENIHETCMHDFIDTLQIILKSFQSDKLDYYLNAMIHGDKLSCETYYIALMIASAYGHDLIVCFLLENYSDYCIVYALNYSSCYDVDYEIDIEHFHK